MEDYDNQTVTLKEPLDLNDLRNPEKDGTVFELADEQAPPEFETNNTFFDNEALAENLYHPIDSDYDTDDDNCTPFERDAKRMEDVSKFKDGGILKKTITHGSGALVTEGSVVRVHYSAYQEYADEPFDSTRLQNQIKKFRVGQGEVIEGLDWAVSTMRRGEVSRFLIKPEYAYGEHGAPPRIPAEATIMFEIELLSFAEHAGLDDYFIMTQDERREVPFSDVKKIYHSITKEAKYMFESNQHRPAFAKYKKAMNLLEDHHLKNEEEEKEQQKLLLKVCLNTAICCVKLCHSGRAIVYCKKALEIDNKSVKALYLYGKKLLLKVCLNKAICCVKLCHSGRAIVYCKKALEIDNKSVKALYLYGKALHQLSEFEKSRSFLLRAQRLKPHDKDINTEIEKLVKDMEEFKFVEKERCAKMFSNPKGQSEEEVEKEVLRYEEEKAKAEKCTPAFEKMVKEKLSEFKEDRDLIEIPMPSYNFTQAELCCVIETAEELGLEHKVRGSGQNTQLKILKKRPQPC